MTMVRHAIDNPSAMIFPIFKMLLSPCVSSTKLQEFFSCFNVGDTADDKYELRGNSLIFPATRTTLKAEGQAE